MGYCQVLMPLLVITLVTRPLVVAVAVVVAVFVATSGNVKVDVFVVLQKPAQPLDTLFEVESEVVVTVVVEYAYEYEYDSAVETEDSTHLELALQLEYEAGVASLALTQVCVDQG